MEERGIIEEIKKWVPIFFLLGLGYLILRYLIFPPPPPPKVKPQARIAVGIGQEAPIPPGIPSELEIEKRYFLGFVLMNTSTIDEEPYPTSFRVEAEIKIPVPLFPDWVESRVFTSPELKYGETWGDYFEFTIPRIWYLTFMMGRTGTVRVTAFVGKEFAGEMTGSFRTVASPVLV